MYTLYDARSRQLRKGSAGFKKDPICAGLHDIIFPSAQCSCRCLEHLMSNGSLRQRTLIDGCSAGRVGFGVDMGATRSLRDTDKSGEAMEATAGALLEADRRMNDPIRKYLFWRQVRPYAHGA